VSDPKRFVKVRRASKFAMELEQEFEGWREIHEDLGGLFGVVLVW
jgi:hypothetical protein